MANAETRFFQKLDWIIQEATADNREPRLASLEAFRDAIWKSVGKGLIEDFGAGFIGCGALSSGRFEPLVFVGGRAIGQICYNSSTSEFDASDH